MLRRFSRKQLRQKGCCLSIFAAMGYKLSYFTDWGIWREILRLSVPCVIANVTVPLIGMADVAIAGHCGGDATIGAIAIGTTIFNMIYRNCSFLRMGGSGITAQAYGAGHKEECALTGLRLILIALIISILLFVLGEPTRQLAMNLVCGADGPVGEATAYVDCRWYAIPASICLFAAAGWFAGMQDTRTPMVVSVVGNILNVIVSAFLAIHCGMGVTGIAAGTVIAQWSSLIISYVAYRRLYAAEMPDVNLSNVFARKPLARLMKVNGDIFLRTLCLVAVFTAFTAFSSRYGETALAANALMMQMFTLFSYLTDGLAFASESLTGSLIGSGNKPRLRKSIDYLLIGSGVVAVAFTVAFAACWQHIFSLFGASEAVISYACAHIGWAVAVPGVCFFAFVADGIMVGATRSAAMRNTMTIASALFFCVYYATRGTLGVNGLWLAFLGYMAARGCLLLNEVRRVRCGD